MSSNSTANQCGNCQASTQATVWCGDCNQCYCSSCSTELHKPKAFSHHQPMPINQKPPTPAYCPAHGEEAKLWCYEHETLICSVCVALEHQGHKTAFFKNVSKEKSTELEQQLHLAQSSLNDHLDLAKQFISIGFNQKAAIAETFRRLRAMLNEHEKQLNERIDEIEQINRNATETHQAQLNSVKMQLDVQGKRLAEILSGNNPINILQQGKSLGDAIKELSQQLSNVKSPGITVFEVKGIDKIQTAMMDCLPLIYMETRQGIPVIPQNAKWARNGTTMIKGLKNPEGLTVDERDGTIYVADYSNHRIVASKPGDTNGRVVAGGNSQGQGLNPLDQPTDVLLDKENNSIIISDYGNQRVMRWSLQSGTTQGETMIDDIDCYGLAMDDYGALYVTVPSGKHEVRRYPKGYTNYTVVAGGNGEGDGLHQLNDPLYIAVDGEGTVYVSDRDNHRVVKWMKEAKEGIVVAGGRGQGGNRTQLSYPLGIVIASNGTLYVAEGGNDRVTRWRKGVNESDIVVGGEWGSESHQLNWPAGLSFDGQGNLYVVDNGNKRVQRFSIE